MFSCSNHESKDSSSKETNSNLSLRGEADNLYVQYGDLTYKQFDDLTASKFVNEEFSNYLTISEENVGIIDNNIATNATLKITNSLTNENINLINIRREANYYIFDAVTSTNEIIKNIKVIDTENDAAKAHPIVRVIIAIILTVIDSQGGGSGSALQQCRAAMMALKCSDGRDPYMEFSNGWFTTTCNVGCR